jgi:hypothetical protein
MVRVILLMALATIIWVPAGVWIGLRPAIAEKVQPLAQFLAAFPANVIFPIVVVLILFPLNPDIWLSFLIVFTFFSTSSLAPRRFQTSRPRFRSRCNILVTGLNPCSGSFRGSFPFMVDKIYALMTKRPEPVAAGREGGFPGMGFGMALPRVSTNTLAGMIEEIAAEPYLGRADLPALADSLQMEVDELFPVAETLQLLRFAEMEEGDIRLTAAGRRFAEADVDVRKKLFGEHLLAYLTLAARIKLVLDERPTHTARAVRFLEELEDYMSEDYADRTLKSVVNWGRYGELFAYDETSEMFSLENPQ